MDSGLEGDASKPARLSPYRSNAFQERDAARYSGLHGLMKRPAPVPLVARTDFSPTNAKSLHNLPAWLACDAKYVAWVNQSSCSDESDKNNTHTLC